MPLGHAPDTRDPYRSRPPVRFVFPDLRGPNDPVLALPPPDAELVHDRFMDGVSIWILQAYLRARAAGRNVELAPDYAPGAVNVVHFDSLRALGAPSDAFLVGVRADRSPFWTCEIEVVQSPCNVGWSASYLVDHWPQPGLIRRDPARGERFERIGFSGFGVNLQPVYRSREFQSELERRGLSLVEHLAGGWNDYSSFDAILAVRTIPWIFLRTKPASKLVNAWLAGVPALLGPEPTYRLVGSPGEDYLEVRTPQDTLRALDRLKSEPELRARLVARGRERARAHDSAAVLKQWLDLLDGPVLAAYDRWVGRGAVMRGMWRRAQRVRGWVDHKAFWVCAHGERVLRGRRDFGG